jgi:ABC-type transport system involved in multi-copper enzyme maturation permease subunit
MNAVTAIARVVLLEMVRRKDFYVLFILTALLTVILGAMNFFNEAGIVRYLKEVCLLLVWLASLVFAVLPAARQLPAERESRTIFPLLAKPVTRAQVILGKFLGCWLACGVALAVFYIFLGIVVGARAQQWPVGDYLSALILHWAALAVVVAMSLLGSVVFAAPSSNSSILFVIIAGILGLGMHLNKIAARFDGWEGSLLSALYVGIPHLEWAWESRALLIHDWGMPGPGTLLLAAAYYGCYAAFFLFLAWLRYRRMPLS